MEQRPIPPAGDVAAIILAAGQGTRMKSNRAKVLHRLCGRPMVAHIVEAVRQSGITRIVVVVGHQAEQVKAHLGPGVAYALQELQLGTGHAVMQAAPLLAGHAGPILITYGDTPLYRPETLRQLVEAHRRSGNQATVLTAFFDDPTGYGRVLRGPSGQVERIVEQRDASPEEAAVREINTGTYCFDAAALFSALQEIRPQNAQSEYYLPDALVVLKRRGAPVGAVVAEDPREAMGINDRVQLAQAEEILRDRIRVQWMRRGVTFEDPRSSFVDASVEIGPDTVIRPFTILEGRTRIGAGCVIGPFVHLQDAVVEDGARVAGHPGMGQP